MLKIKNDAELEAATARVWELLKIHRTEDEEKELEELSDDIWQYEEIHYPIN